MFLFFRVFHYLNVCGLLTKWCGGCKKRAYFSRKCQKAIDIELNSSNITESTKHNLITKLYSFFLSMGLIQTGIFFCSFFFGKNAYYLGSSFWDFIFFAFLLKIYLGNLMHYWRTQLCACAVCSCAAPILAGKWKRERGFLFLLVSSSFFFLPSFVFASASFGLYMGVCSDAAAVLHCIYSNAQLL